MKEIIYQHDHVTVWYHTEPRIIHHRVHQAARGEPFRAALSAGLDCLRQRGACKWLSDDRLHFVLPADDQRWATQVWFPEARDAGWRYWAITRPEKAVADLFLRRIAAGFSKRGVTTQVFGDPELAMRWLVSAASESPAAELGDLE